MAFRAIKVWGLKIDFESASSSIMCEKQTRKEEQMAQIFMCLRVCLFHLHQCS